MPWSYLFDFISLQSLLQIAAAVWNEKQKKKKAWNSQNSKGTSKVFCNSLKAAADDAFYYKKKKENDESNEKEKKYKVRRQGNEKKHKNWICAVSGRKATAKIEEKKTKTKKYLYELKNICCKFCLLLQLATTLCYTCRQTNTVDIEFNVAQSKLMCKHSRLFSWYFVALPMQYNGRKSIWRWSLWVGMVGLTTIIFFCNTDTLLCIKSTTVDNIVIQHHYR